jgi:hypothetical protein
LLDLHQAMSNANNASEIAPALHHATRFSTLMIPPSSFRSSALLDVT